MDEIVHLEIILAIGFTVLFAAQLLTIRELCRMSAASDALAQAVTDLTNEVGLIADELTTIAQSDGVEQAAADKITAQVERLKAAAGNVGPLPAVA